MTLHLPAINTQARFLLIGYGLVLLFWMSVEDNGTLSVALLGTGTTVIFGGYTLLNRFGGRSYKTQSVIIGFVICCACLGAIAPLTTALLMFFKSSWHGHIFPDYPPAMIIAMARYIPIWALAGGLVGLSLAIFTVLNQSQTRTQW